MKNILFTLLMLITMLTSAQTAAEAERLFNNKQYQPSLNIYEQLLKRRPSDALLNYKAARSAYELGNFFAAAHYFGKSGTKYSLTPFYLGESLVKSYQFEKAIPALQAFIDSKSTDETKRELCSELLKKATLGSTLMKRVQEITIIDSSIVNKNDFLNFYKFSTDLGTIKQQQFKLNNQTVDKITFVTQRDDRKCFSDTAKGNFNLYTSYKLMEKWGSVTSLSKSLNTSYNENYPFLMPDGITLYYASDGENSMGGYDIFMTRYAAASKDFLSPDNVGFPFNSSANDYMMVLDESQQTGWFATDRNQPATKVAIYSFQLKNEKKFLSSIDSVETYKFATLKKYKIATEKKISPATKKTKPATNQTLNIIINDSIQYADPSEFKSKKAEQLYREALDLEKKFEILNQQINQIRNDYMNAEQNQKQQMANKINQLEPLSFQLRKDISSKKKEAINEEQKNLIAK